MFACSASPTSWRWRAPASIDSIESPAASTTVKTRDPIVSSSAPQTDSAASSVQPPAKTESLAKRRCSRSSGRSWLHAIVSRSVRCRSGKSRTAGQERQALV
jgi:hypothetical protein